MRRSTAIKRADTAVGGAVIVPAQGLFSNADQSVTAIGDGSSSRSGALVSEGAGIRILLVRSRGGSDLWNRYWAGAFAAYSRHRVERVLAMPDVAAGDDLRWFAVAVDEGGEVIGGLRVNGPLARVADAAVLSEFAAYPIAAASIGQVLNGAIDDGIAEIKGFWVRHDETRRDSVAGALADSVVAIGRRLGVRHMFCTSAGHASDRWAVAGAVHLRSVPAVPFPDARYRTIVHWWDLALTESGTP